MSHFTIEELCQSDIGERAGIVNIPSPIVLVNLNNLIISLEKVRELLGGKSIHINSGYRSPTLNRFIGGSNTSAHCLGFAADFKCKDFGTPKEITQLIKDSGLKYDQLIYEGTWVHISIDPKMRQQTLTATFKDGKASYSEFK
jgi:putative chitinase